MLARERPFAGEDLVSDHRERELVRPAGDLGALHLLGRHVVGRPDQRAGHGVAVRRGVDFGDAEIGHFDVAVAAQHDIGGLDVAVDDALGVSVIESRPSLAQDGEQPARFERLAGGHDVLEGRAVDILHRDISDAVLLGHVVNGDDVGMRQHPGRAGLAEETLAQFLALLSAVDVAQADGFDGDGAADGGIGGQVHDSHSAAADFLDDTVPANTVHQVLV